jgi:putative FmdB family regulatory protein
MPIYEYQCDECGHQFEKIQGFSGPHTLKCGLCGAKAKRVVSQCTFHLKGNGWYATDYANKPTTKTGKKYKQDKKKAELNKEVVKKD